MPFVSAIVDGPYRQKAANSFTSEDMTDYFNWYYENVEV